VVGGKGKGGGLRNGEEERRKAAVVMMKLEKWEEMAAYG